MDRKGFSPLAPMPASQVAGSNYSVVALTEQDLPVAFWRAFGVPGTILILASQWSPQGWSTPVTLDTIPASRFIESFEAIRDASGRVHLVYNRSLDPPEKYTAIPFTEGLDVPVFRPDKAFDVYLEKGSWSRPASTTGRGKFDLSEFNISLDRSGDLCLSGIARADSSHKTEAIVRQFWKGGKWSELSSLTDTMEVESSWVFLDLRGLTHIWFNRNYASWFYQQLDNGARREVPPPCNLLRPIIRPFPDGRIALLSQGKLTVWNGQEWCPPLSVAALDMSITPAGSIMTWAWEGKTVQIREVSLEKASTDATLSSSRPN